MTEVFFDSRISKWGCKRLQDSYTFTNYWDDDPKCPTCNQVHNESCSNQDWHSENENSWRDAKTKACTDCDGSIVDGDCNC